MIIVKIFLWIFVAVAFVNALSYSILAYERLNLERRSVVLRDLLPFFAGYTIETLSSFFLFLVTPIGYLFGRRLNIKGKKDNKNTYPVLFVHGYSRNLSDFFVILFVLWRKGFSRLYAINYDSFSKTIQEIAALLEREVERICNKENTNKVIIVAHSLGGVASRYLMSVMKNDRIFRLISIGSPYRGTRMAVFGVGKSSVHLLTDHPFFDSFSMVDDVKRIFSIYSTHDNIVIPYNSPVIEGGNNLEINWAGHATLLFHPAVVKWVKKNLMVEIDDDKEKDSIKEDNGAGK